MIHAINLTYHSISALQWLCNADKKEHNPRHRLNVFFQSLYNCLTRGARAILQFYPSDPSQMEMITNSAMKYSIRVYKSVIIYKVNQLIHSDVDLQEDWWLISQTLQKQRNTF